MFPYITLPLIQHWYSVNLTANFKWLLTEVAVHVQCETDNDLRPGRVLHNCVKCGLVSEGRDYRGQGRLSERSHVSPRIGRAVSLHLTNSRCVPPWPCFQVLRTQLSDKVLSEFRTTLFVPQDSFVMFSSCVHNSCQSTFVPRDTSISKGECKRHEGVLE